MEKGKNNQLAGELQSAIKLKDRISRVKSKKFQKLNVAKELLKNCEIKKNSLKKDNIKLRFFKKQYDRAESQRKSTLQSKKNITRNNNRNNNCTMIFVSTS